MSRSYSKILICIWMLTELTACKVYYPAQETASVIKIDGRVAYTFINTYCRPYKDSLDKIMKVPVAELENDLTKKLPESSLGNLMADILKVKAAQYTKETIDIAILNYGGIRVSSLSKGLLRVEHAYLLMPFDNYIVVQTLTGQQISDFCDSIALKNGWPVSGIAFKISKGKAADIKVNNVPLDAKKSYQVALNDYLANGGDGMTFLKKIPQQQTGKLFRDAIIEYWSDQTNESKKISSAVENRITYAE